MAVMSGVPRQMVVRRQASSARPTVGSHLSSKGVHLQVIAHVEPLQQRYTAIMEDEGYLDTVLAQGAGKQFKLLCKAVDELFNNMTSPLKPSTAAVSDTWIILLSKQGIKHDKGSAGL